MRTVNVKGLLTMAAALFGALCVWQPPLAPGEAGAPAFAETKKTRAKEVFDQRCARCHGQDGRGATRLGEMLGAPDFTDAEWWRDGVSDERLKTSISEGKGEMPAFARKLSRTEISSLAAYVRDFQTTAGKENLR